MFRFGDPGGRIYTSVGASNANQLALWTGPSSSLGQFSVSAGAGRHDSGSALAVNMNTSGAAVSKVLDSQPTWGVAFALKPPSFPSGTVTLWSFDDAGSTQLDLRLTTAGTFQVTRAGTVLGTSAAVPANAWTHVEFKVTIHPSAGTVGLWLNGAAAVNLTGQNTRSTANSTANGFRMGAFNGQGFFSTMNYLWDDIIVYDGQATDPNGFADITGPIGDCGLAWLPPTGAGTTTQFAPDTGANYARVNEATPDGDASYVESATVGQTDTYAVADLPAAAGAVKSLAAVHYARKTDVGSRGMKSVLRSAGANATHAAELALGDSYQYLWSTWGQDPNNGAPQNWTPASVNALEAGQAVSS